MDKHSIENEKVISRTENCVELEFFVPQTCDFFDGHFPKFKLLPAVAQIQIITRFAKEYFDVPPFISNAKRLKFLMPLFPESKVYLKLEHKQEKHSISFVLAKAQDTSAMYSTGNFTY